MDRTAFLSSLPFLIPLQFPAWPPSSAAGSSSSKVVLGDHSYGSFQLSLECHGKPAFFAVSSHKQQDSSKNYSRAVGGDPALTPIELVIAEETTSSNGAPEEADVVSSSSVYLRVEGHVYAMQLPPAIEMVPETYQDDDDDGED